MPDVTVIDVTDRAGAVVAPHWLAAAERLHRDLRPQLAPDYAGAMSRVFQSGGRLIVAAHADVAVGLAVWRVVENTMYGRFLYIDDLVTDSALRSGGVGKALLSRCETVGIESGCSELVLDSGVQRGRSHRFYFREGFVVRAFHFGKPLTLTSLPPESGPGSATITTTPQD